MENAGIDPATSHMLSEHSTIWANSPICKNSHKVKKILDSKHSLWLWFYVAGTGTFNGKLKPVFDVQIFVKYWSLDSSAGRALEF